MHGAEPLYDSHAARAIDRAAGERAGLSGHELMARAARAALDALRTHWPAARRLLVVCGGGNNGGDGYVLARLARADGLDVALLALQRSPPRQVEAQQAQQQWKDAGGRTTPWRGEPLPAADVVVDALFGIGLERPPDDDAARLIDAINVHPAPVLALDVPSGVDADRGVAPGAAVNAERTIAFIVGKRGLFTGPARDHVGSVSLADLGVPSAARDVASPLADRLDASRLAGCLPRRHANAHKGEHGHVLAVGGDHGFGGALRLCAEAALRVGAGLVSVLTRSEHRSGMLSALPECMVVCSEHGELPLDLVHRATVLALGPGLGTAEWGRDLLPRLLDGDRPAVLDADALNLLAEAPRPLPGRVLTPHPGEAARLLGLGSAKDIQRDRFGALDALVRRYQAVIVLKGAGTLVGAPGERPQVIDAGNPGMASGGMGDLLTGVIAGLLAQRLSPFEAAVTGSLLHAVAGDVAAADGERGLLARDLLDPLRRLANR